MEKFQLAQINVARKKGVSIDDHIMKEFIDNLDKINSLAESSKGFVWRLKDESNNATHLNSYSDKQVIINRSVWETIEDLERFVYRSFHTDFLSSTFSILPFYFISPILFRKPGFLSKNCRLFLVFLPASAQRLLSDSVTLDVTSLLCFRRPAFVYFY